MSPVENAEQIAEALRYQGLFNIPEEELAKRIAEAAEIGQWSIEGDTVTFRVSGEKGDAEISLSGSLFSRLDIGFKRKAEGLLVHDEQLSGRPRDLEVGPGILSRHQAEAMAELVGLEEVRAVEFTLVVDSGSILRESPQTRILLHQSGKSSIR